MIHVDYRLRAGAFVLTAALSAFASRPAVADGIIGRCAIPQPCAAYKNTVGWGIEGLITANTGSHAGVLGQDISTGNGSNDGVLGVVGDGGYGVEGTSSDYALGGVRGVATNGIGVFGSSNANIGAYGLSSNYIGVVARSANYIGSYGASTASSGVYGLSQSGFGVEGFSYGSDAGHFTSPGGGTAVVARSATGYGLIAVTGGSVGAYVLNSNGNATDVQGSYIGLLGRSDAYPLLLTNTAAANLFYVDGSGNVFSHGTYRTFAATRQPGQAAVTYATQTTTPNIEDVGSARLVGGSATVKFDPAFAASIDLQTLYQVFLTPGGDTRGLFIASKTSSEFVVRETQGGRGNLTFDYRIVARTFGHAGERMALVRATEMDVPKAPLVTYRPHPSTLVHNVPQRTKAALIR